MIKLEAKPGPYPQISKFIFRFHVQRKVVQPNALEFRVLVKLTQLGQGRDKAKCHSSLGVGTRPTKICIEGYGGMPDGGLPISDLPAAPNQNHSGHNEP